jgi:hypothetical protein
LLGQKFSVSPDQFSIEINLPSAVVRSLDVYHVPVYLASIPIIGFFISLSRREMKRAGDLLIK